MESKESKVLELFFNEPTKHWHFEEILKEAKITRSKATSWLKKLEQEHIIKKIKEPKKMPYYIGNYEAPEYGNKKRIFGWNKLHESGLFNYLLSLSKAETVILFGSFARADWYKESDIDIFIYGDVEEIHLTKYELVLKREIQVFIVENRKSFRKIREGLLKNIMQGIHLKGSLELEVRHNDKISFKGRSIR